MSRLGAARTWLPAAFVLILVAVGAWLAHREWDEVREALHALSASRLLAAFMLALAGMVAMMASWFHAASAVGVPFTWQQGRAIFPVAQLTKYVPGGVWPVLAQATLGRQVGVSAASTAVAGVAHLLLSVGVALLVGSGAAAMATNVSPAVLLLAAAAGLASLAALTPPVLVRVLGWAQRRSPSHEPGLINLSARRLGLSAVWCVVANLMLGAQVAALLPGVDLADAIGAAVGAYCLASAAGVLVLFAPAGAGAREGVMALVLAPVVGTGVALLAALASRAVLMAVDVALAATQAGAVSAVVRARAAGRLDRRP